MTKVALQYEPRKQFLPFHARDSRFACMVCHRRAGKTVSTVHEIVIRALRTGKKNARYAYVAPFYRQAKDVAWQYLKEATEDIRMRARESDLRVELPNGAWITLYGSDNPDAMRGLYFDGVVLDEYGDCRPSLWSQVILPTLVDRQGWAIFIGTPKGRNHFWQIYERSKKEPNWYHLTLRASESGIVKAEELAEMRAQMTEEEYQQEMECDFNAAVIGTYYSGMIQQMELAGSIGQHVAQYDSSFPVKAAADLGRSDNTAIWFWQETPAGINVIDYYENQGEHIDHYIEMLREKGYRYEEIWLPHDATAKTLATKRSTIEQMLDAGLPCRKTPRLDVQDGIAAVRKVLPTLKINQVHCFAGIEALRAYKRQYNELTKQFSVTPKHDWASDGADAFRYFSLVCAQQTRKSARPQNTSTTPHLSQNLNEMFADRERHLKQNKMRI
ncbi:MAG: terminase large subunit domain-containing protein [Desulfobulbia bacterium]